MVRHDLVIFGASGFTGKYVIDYVAKRAQEEGFTWAVAGRSKEKLRESLAESKQRTNLPVEKVPILIVNIKDEKSIDAMAEAAKVILNCVGPFRFYGEAVVAAAVRAGASHVDISGEPSYMADVQIKFHEAAKAKGCYVVSGCGFDSIPAEYGLLELLGKFPGDVNDVDMYYQIKAPKGGGAHFGTWQSAIHAFSNAAEVQTLTRKLMPERLPVSAHKQKARVFKWNEGLKKYGVLFPASDRSVIRRTQYYRSITEGERPVQFESYIAVPRLFGVLMTILFGMFFGIMAKFSWGRHLLLTYPRFCSGGVFSHEGPSREQTESTTFRLTLEGHGWGNHLSDPAQQHTSPPDHTMTCVVDGPEPGYWATSGLLAEAAFTLLREADKCPSTGGVYTPASCFKGTSLRTRLGKAGVTIKTK